MVLTHLSCNWQLGRSIFQKTRSPVSTSSISSIALPEFFARLPLKFSRPAFHTGHPSNPHSRTLSSIILLHHEHPITSARILSHPYSPLGRGAGRGWRRRPLDRTTYLGSLLVVEQEECEEGNCRVQRSYQGYLSCVLVNKAIYISLSETNEVTRELDHRIEGCL